MTDTSHLTPLEDTDPEWMADAACYDTGTNPFFPTRGGSVDIRDCCNGTGGHDVPCPVKDDCLAYALEHKIRFGIWGGTTGEQRTLMLRRSGARRQPRTQ